ncbi:Putative signal peptide peptidase SppA [BD1-7 clade bacterium]|uniref:Signal peptide peptidase SppA n=1 Tax=BD1-7 clade bacterium TaxID=2029982 RepID=A0A5S9PW60_9GAMM|nr:Putative signal peptide peptidase SppA [BD1-7 clade bacterium]
MEQKSKEWQLLEKAVLASVTEQRRARRWRIFFVVLFFVYLFSILGIVTQNADMAAVAKTSEHTAVVRIQGPIMEQEPASANAIATGLRAAFKEPNAKAIILAINSPGGSPVQAGYAYDEIMRLRKLHPEKKVYAVISDLGASAAYYIASAADEIYADKASLVGSIGVISAGFGFVGTIDKLGVERRVITSGKNKAFMDPFEPLKPSDEKFWRDSLDLIHQQFITAVKTGRSDRLKETDDMFSGLIWPGETALELGLVDGLGSAGYVARDIVGAKDTVDYTVSRDPIERLIRQLGASAGAAVYQQLQMSDTAPAIR